MNSSDVCRKVSFYLDGHITEGVWEKTYNLVWLSCENCRRKVMIDVADVDDKPFEGVSCLKEVDYEKVLDIRKHLNIRKMSYKCIDCLDIGNVY